MNKKKKTYLLRALVLAVSIPLAAPLGVTASPLERLADSRGGLSSLWQWLTCLWGKEGSHIDPDGAGSSIDPDGAGGDIDPSGDRSGSDIDPNGGASLASPDEGSSIDPSGSR